MLSLKRPCLLGFLAAAILFGLPAFPAGAVAQKSVERIAAVVNDDIVSLSDLEARLNLAIVSSNLPDTPEARQRIKPQVLRTLVDESLQMQEAKRLNIEVTDEDIDKALERLAQQNKLPRAQMEKFLASRGVSIDTVKQQLTAGIAWSKLVQRRLRPNVEIGDEEVEAALARIQANAGKPEYLVAEIFLAVDQPDQDEPVLRLAERLVEQIRNGAHFSAVAGQFSQSAGAGNGGDLGWIQQDQLAPELDRVLRLMAPGQISKPIRGASGYHILMLRDQRAVMAGSARETKVKLKQMVLPLARGADAKTVSGQMARARELAQAASDCETFEKAANKAAIFSSGLSGDLGTVSIADLPPDLARVVANLPIGKASPPLRGENGIAVLMVCERQTPPSSLPAREEVANSLGMERLDMLQRRYLRDLRRAAFIEMRV